MVDRVKEILAEADSTAIRLPFEEALRRLGPEPVRKLQEKRSIMIWQERDEEWVRVLEGKEPNGDQPA